MTMLKATIKGGRLEVDVPADWPDGSVVEVYPLERGTQSDAVAMASPTPSSPWDRIIGAGYNASATPNVYWFFGCISTCGSMGWHAMISWPCGNIDPIHLEVI